MEHKSIETKNLLNPAFCGLVYASLVDGYNSKSKKSIPFYLPYILLPIVLHKESRFKIPSTSISKFHIWLQQSEEIKIGLKNRSKNLKPFVSNAALFLHGQGLISSDDNFRIDIQNHKKLNKIINSSISIKEYTKKAKTLGAICGKTNSNTTLLALLGVTL